MQPYSELVAEGKLPRPGTGGGGGGGAGPASIWICPEASDQGWKYYWSYGMNMGLSVEQASENNGMPDKITGIGSLSTIVLMADGPGIIARSFRRNFRMATTRWRGTTGG
jgi:hypothetical protein